MFSAIIDYGMGNVASVKKALNVVGVESKITGDEEDIRNAKYLILPGVGSFAQGMDNLRSSSLDKIIKDEIYSKRKPILGICLGMQLLATLGTEPYERKGLNLVEGKVNKIINPNLRVPHLGWNSIIASKGSFFEDFNQKDFYFIHSYHFEVKDSNKIGALVEYGEKYVAAIQYENVLATQFHPEKSQDQGIMLLEKFFKFYA